MKTLLFASAALAALTIAAQAAGLNNGPTSASHQPSGDLAVYGGLFDLTTPYNSPNDNTRGSMFGGLGRANIWLSPMLSAQFDVGAESYLETHYSSEGSTVMNFAGHLSYRDRPGHLIGAFASVGNDTNWWRSAFATIGAEGQMYLGPILLYGQAGYTTSFSRQISEYVSGAAYVHGEGRYFFNPNLMLAANFGYARFTEFESGNEPHDIFRWGADLEWKDNTSPFGAFLSYQGSYDIEPLYTDDNTTVHTALVGIKMHFGDKTLKAQSDTGATLRDLNPFTGTNFVRLSDWE